ncbi:zinc ABC transporter substrate-binding protein [Epibacterium ulvae]|uniref:zinc ABC transporter substrate-binding protein n=1 Tax=Epibacterium ulvae TaxID=1156985 RepID=UPI00248FFFD0|nr:zinc ABC transporter substrate-binding protein [Epibacterium ulvae]
MRQLLGTAFAATWIATISWADVPRVATDIAPIHGLVSQVMKDLGEPDLIIRPGASPHSYALRPSEARALSQADLVVWIGEGLAPWLEPSIEQLATNAHVLELLALPSTTILPYREGATFETHDHDEHDAHDDHGHDEDHKDHEGHDEHSEHAHDEHNHDEHAKHNEEHESHDAHPEHDEHAHDEHHQDEHADHDKKHDDHHGHGHSAGDPHVWLSPENAITWLSVIAEELSELDPENASKYQKNAQEGIAKIQQTKADLAPQLSNIADKSFVVFHDAYQYFEISFGVTAAGAISLGDASDPSPARIAEVRDTVRDLNVACAFREPQYNSGLVDTVLEGTEAKALILDPLGTKLELGSDFYPELLQEMGKTLIACVN